MVHFGSRLQALLASPLFFWGIILFFILEALWFVFFMAYPMAFDEDFHVGVIKIYAEQWSPLLGTQPENADAFGALARDPSYLFHYVMSFPYRLLVALTSNEQTTIIVLRILNVAIFTSGLLLFRRILKNLAVSTPLSHTILAIFVLIPIVPWLAATVNYDNLFFLLFAWVLLLATKLYFDFSRQRINILAALVFILACLLLSLVKYAALPILLAIVGFLAFEFYKNFRNQFDSLGAKLQANFTSIPKKIIFLLVLLITIIGGLFIERYGLNIIHYKTPAPDCAQVISVEQCKQYGPWGRDYELARTKGEVDTNPLTYTGMWLYGMWERSFFAVSGSANDHETKPGLPWITAAAALLALTGIGTTFVLYRKLIRHTPLFRMILLFSGVYIFILWMTLYGSYLKTGQPVAINGRYLLPLLPLFGAIFGQAFSIALQNKIQIKPYLSIFTILLFLCGGGVFTFMILAETSWYW